MVPLKAQTHSQASQGLSVSVITHLKMNLGLEGILQKIRKPPLNQMSGGLCIKEGVCLHTSADIILQYCMYTWQHH